jgi:Kelch motif/Galactose oxidase, central domain
MQRQQQQQQQAFPAAWPRPVAAADNEAGGGQQMRPPQPHDSLTSSYNFSSNAACSHSNHQLFRQCLTWTRIPVPNSVVVPPPRSGAASVVVKGRLYIFGGYGGGTGRLDDFYSYHFESGTWEEVTVLSSVKPGCRENNGVVISDSHRKIYLFGGYNGMSWLNDLWEFDIESKIWTCIQEVSDPPPNIMDAAAAERHDGGNDAAVGAKSSSSSAGFVQGHAPSRRFGYVSVVHQGKFVLWGGFDGRYVVVNTCVLLFMRTNLTLPLVVVG